MLANIAEALQGFLSLGSFGLVFLGSVIGLVFGIIPGLTGSMAIALIIPLTYTMNDISSIILLIAVYVGGISGGCISAILLGIPGTNSSVATTFDGHPMVKQGRTSEALSAAVIANAIGTLPSMLIGMFLSVGLSRLALHLSAWEYCTLGLLAITMVSTLSKGNMIKGLLGASLGLLFSCVGAAPIDGTLRFTFDNYNLLGGFNLTYVILGVFASRIIIVEFAKMKAGSEPKVGKVDRFKWPGKALRENKRSIIESWLMGLWIGFLPGFGSSVSSMVAYGRAKNTSKNPEEYGNGAVGGVIAPEVANNASVGGALIPMMALGIPGDGSTAYLLGALMLHGMDPGPLLFTEQPIFSYTVFLAGILAAIATLFVQTVGLRICPKVLKIPMHYLYPAIIACCFIGVFANTKTMFGILMLLLFTVIGILFTIANIPVAPFTMSFVIGEIIETNMRRAMTYSTNGVWSFITRPVSGLLVLAVIYCILSPIIKAAIAKAKAKKAAV